MGHLNTYPYPTPEQINHDDPKSFSDAELSAYHSAIEKLTEANNHNNNPNRTVDAHLTSEEQAAFDKYTQDLELHWQAPPGAVEPDWAGSGQNGQYQEGTTYVGPNGSPALGETINKPPVPDPVAGGEEGKGDLVVNTEAIKTFKANLGELQKILADVQSKVNGMEPIRPGYFGLGGSMFKAITGSSGAPGLKDNTEQFLHHSVNTFEKLMADIDAMVKEYDTAEELSTATTEQMNKVFEDAFGSYNDLGSPTQ